MSIARKFVLALAAVLIAGCGGGSPEPEVFSQQAMAAAQTSAVTTASVTPAAAADLLMNTAETAYAALFPVHQATQTFGPFAFRYYPTTGMYLGVVITSSGAYTLNGIYLVGNGFGTLANPKYMGLVTDFVAVTIDPGLTYKNLTVTVTVQGYSTTVQVGSVPVPVTQVDFCGSFSTDATVQALLQLYGASFTLTGCTFGGTSGSFSGTITMAPYGTIPFSVTYTYV
ncbi:MAG: hypothetical protein ACXWJM_03150 [Ramlibacter sp.]